MNKILTISVAAYNVEKFLENTLKSLADSRYVDKLEVFVVDDGGKDRSLEIAKHYEEQFPQTFHAIHKENGGYGSTVNYSIAHATGKYFKLLDGDDWMNCNGMDYILRRLERCEEDVIITDYYIGPSENELKVIHTRNDDNSVIRVKDYETAFPHGMWSLFYKTDMLKRSNLVLPEHMLYTDQVYSTIPFSIAETIRFINTPVYCYRYGRAEQSTSLPSRLKHADEMLKLCSDLMTFYESHSGDNNKYLFSRIARYNIVAIRTLLLFPINNNNLKRVKEYEKQIKEQYPEFYYSAENKSGMGKLIKMLRKTKYLAYWGIKFIPESVLNR